MEKAKGEALRIRLEGEMQLERERVEHQSPTEETVRRIGASRRGSHVFVKVGAEHMRGIETKHGPR